MTPTAASFYAITTNGLQLCHYLNGDVVNSNGDKVELIA